MDNGKLWLERIFRLIGGKGVLLFAIGVASALLLSLVELALAVFLMVFLHTLHLVDISQLPGWLPVDVGRLSPLTIWLWLLAIGIIQAAGLMIHYEAKGQLTEGAQARMRLALGYRALLSRETRCLPLSEMNLYTAEFFPKTASFVFYANQVMSFVIQATMLTIWMFLIAQGETLVGLAGLGLMGALVLRFNHYIHRFGRQVPLAQQDLERSKVRIARNWLLINLFRIQEQEFENWRRATFSYYRSATLAFRFSSLGVVVMPVLGILVIATIILGNFSFFHTPVTNLVAFLYLFVRFEQMVANGSSLLGGLLTYRTQVEKTLDFMMSFSAEELRKALEGTKSLRILHYQPHLSSILRPQSSRKSDAATVPPPGIELVDVSFTWPGCDTPVVSDLSLQIAPGEQVGIVGSNGCGKSTLLGILLGVFRPSAGTVTIGGQAGEAYILANAHALAYVGPEPYLIHGSIRNNLTYGFDGPITEEGVWNALGKVGMAAVVRSLPGGLEYPIQEDGEGLSSGQKQGLAMARCFFRQPSLLVMDEPSANLDAAAEECILGALRELRRRCTVIVVSHRARMLDEVDRVFRMSESKKA